MDDLDFAQTKANMMEWVKQNLIVIFRTDGIRNGDLGYPSTVQLADGTIVTALYYASGSETSADWGAWGDISCQAIHYRAENVRA